MKIKIKNERMFEPSEVFAIIEPEWMGGEFEICSSAKTEEEAWIMNCGFGGDWEDRVAECKKEGMQCIKVIVMFEYTPK